MATQCEHERFLIMQDTAEIQCNALNVVPLYSGLHVSMTELLRFSLRNRPDRILVGEVRGPEALDLLMALNTGHEGGAATLHANSAQAALGRLALLVGMHGNAPRHIEPLIGDTRPVIIQIARKEGHRRVTEILFVEGYSEGQYTFSPSLAADLEK
jgi:type IV secretion system protein VirB11